MSWLVWFLMALLTLFIEIFMPGYYFMSIGIGAMAAGLLSLLIQNYIAQSVVFLIAFSIALLILRTNRDKFFDQSRIVFKIRNLTGEKGTVTKEIGAKSKGFVRIGNDEWPAVSLNNDSISAQSVVIVKEIRNNRLIVDKMQ